ncbi:Kelch repeat-containing protein [Humisphaera borealis]|uniref:Carbohydrate-binding protein n=1 Tax=Humisphaera borealis TaxID=2807512 RepID=A0A7M2X425_9BACT|nr:kelch repeat-containing protein [Humisphaera borealis]QOV91781.1 carbohydrate-binding protein [Humisphaera borealis]
MKIDRRTATMKQAVVSALEGLERRILFAAAYQQGTGGNALMSMEAEAYDAAVAQGGKTWTAYTGAGFSGTGARQATPNTGANIDAGYLTGSPRLDFRVNFARTGTHYVWVRGLGATDQDNSLHVGLDGVAPTTSDKLTFPNTSYGWSRATMDGPIATINVPTTGLHTISIWMREDGVVADKIVLTASSTYTPTGTGPAVSSRVDVPVPLSTVTIAATDASASEAAGNPGAFTVSRSGGDTTQALVVGYVVSGTATNGTDYSTLGSTVTIPAGATTAVINVVPVDDTAVEASETVTLTLASSVAYTLGAATFGTVTIADNDTAVPPPPPPPPPAGQTPFGGVAWAVPGKIEAENFDDGGEGVAFHDADTVNGGGAYRTTAVDIEATTDTGGGFNIGRIVAGEWLEYTVNIATAGSYDLGIRFATASGGGTAHLEVDGVATGGSITLPGTGGWQTWQTVSKPGLNLTAGQHVLRLAFDASAGGDIGNLNWLTLTASPTVPPPPPPPPPAGQLPFGGAAWALPGKIEVENFDEGGEGIAYHDTDTTNVSGAYRASGVDVEAITDAGPGYAVGHASVGEWLEYTVNVATSGTYDVSVRASADAGYGGTFHIEVDGANVTGAMALSPTGGWQTYATIIKTGVALTAGSHVVRIAFDATNSGGDIGNFDWVQFTSTANPAPTSPFAWNAIAPSPISRGEGQAAVVNGKLYAFGGFYNDLFLATTRCDVYDPSNNTWTRIADMPEPVTHAGTVVVGTTVWFVGGFLGDNPGPEIASVWKYDTLTNTWSAGPSLPASRAGGGAALVGSEIHFFGGRSRTLALGDMDYGDHWVLPVNGGTTWESRAAMPNPRNHLAGAAVNGLVYAIGGQHLADEFGGNQVELDAYNPTTNTWTRLADLSVARGHISSSVLVRNGRILVIGGTVNGDLPSSDIAEYDPATNAWSKLQSLPQGRKTPVAGLIGDKLFVVGGDSPNPVAGGWVGQISKTWSTGTPLPVALGEVAGGVIAGKMYIVGEGSSATLAYNISTGAWQSNLAVRPFVGNHHVAEVVSGRLYLIGGLGGSSEGKVQIYNPLTNTWSTGANMPFAAGSSSSAVINGEIFVAGGIIGSSTTNQVAKYNPQTNAWTLLAAMPQGVNHAASATDGTRLYVFGGRDGGNIPSNGFNYTQVYDPATNTWTSSGSGAPLAPLPQARGGTGKAVFANGEFYVMGGETSTGAGATANKVYSRVDIYNPLTNTWRVGSPMPTARHGIFPLYFAGRAYLAGGGTQAGASTSNLLEIYDLN